MEGKIKKEQNVDKNKKVSDHLSLVSLFSLVSASNEKGKEKKKEIMVKVRSLILIIEGKKASDGRATKETKIGIEMGIFFAPLDPRRKS